eukprot:s768_g13.t3
MHLMTAMMVMIMMMMTMQMRTVAKMVVVLLRLRLRLLLEDEVAYDDNDDGCDDDDDDDRVFFFQFPAKGDGVSIAGKKGATFTREDILTAYQAGHVEGLCPKRMETNPFSKDDFDMTWAERLWSRPYKGYGVMDMVLLGSKVSPTSYTDKAPGENKGKYTTEVPKTLTRCTGGPKDPNYGKWQDKDDVKNWKKARKMFFEKMREVIDSQVALDNNDEFIRHLTYFTSAIGPIVEEAFFINEALNDMKGYLGYWAKTSQLSAPGSIINLWPPEELKVKGKDNQIVDYTDGSKISEMGYDIFKFLKPKDAEESYAEQLSYGQDGIMLVTMLEYIRRISVRRDKNTKVLVGVFVRPMESIEDQAAISGDEAKFIREENRMLRRQLENHPEVQRMIAENWALREELRALDPTGWPRVPGQPSPAGSGDGENKVLPSPPSISSEVLAGVEADDESSSKTWFYFQKMAKEVEELMRAKESLSHAIERTQRETGGASQGLSSEVQSLTSQPAKEASGAVPVSSVVELDIATQEALKQAQGLLQGPGCARLPAVTAAGAAGRRGAKEVDDGRSPERGFAPPEQVGAVPCDDEERFKQAVQRIEQLQGTVDLVSAAYGDAFDEFQRLREEYESRLEECQFFELQCSRLNLTCLDLAERLSGGKSAMRPRPGFSTTGLWHSQSAVERQKRSFSMSSLRDATFWQQRFEELRELTGADPLPEDLSVTEMPARSSESLQGSTPWMLGDIDSGYHRHSFGAGNVVQSSSLSALRSETSRQLLFKNSACLTEMLTAYADCAHLPSMATATTETDEALAGIDFVPSMEAPLENQSDRRALRLEEQPPLAAKQLQANYGIGYAMLVNMGYSGGGPTPLCGVKRLTRAGLQEDEAMVVDATMKRGVKRRSFDSMERWAKLDNQRQGQAEFDTEEGEDAESVDEDEELCGLGKALVRELRSTREKKLSIPQLAKKPRVLRVLDLWQVEADLERFLKQFVRDELQSICELVRSTGIAIKKITNKTSRFARACEEAWVVHLKGQKQKEQKATAVPSPTGAALGIVPSAEPPAEARTAFIQMTGELMLAQVGCRSQLRKQSLHQRFMVLCDFERRAAACLLGLELNGREAQRPQSLVDLLFGRRWLCLACFWESKPETMTSSSRKPRAEVAADAVHRNFSLSRRLAAAEPAASTDFRDADGYDFVGACCSLESCGLRDFLPFTCPHCSRSFCQDHVAPAKHDCGQATQSQGMVAALCFRCGTTVKWEDAASSEQEAMKEHLKVCKPLPQTAKEKLRLL